jgi:hypothetical protein
VLLLAVVVVAAIALGALVAPWIFLIAVAAGLVWLTLFFVRVV